MQIKCPGCQSQHDIERDIPDAALICPHCGQEIWPEQENRTEPDTPVWHFIDRACPLSPFLSTADCKVVYPDEKLQDIPPPMPLLRKNDQLWPWIVVMLILTAIAGFWLQHEKWLDNRWFRSTAINLGFPVQEREKDWQIPAQHVKAEWITQSDGNEALLIRGKLKNLLSVELSLPAIEVSFFDHAKPQKLAGKQQFDITLQPDKQLLQQAPYKAPAIDTMPVGPLSSRSFILLLESVPEGSHNFTLSVNTRSN